MRRRSGPDAASARTATDEVAAAVDDSLTPARTRAPDRHTVDPQQLDLLASSPVDEDVAAVLACVAGDRVHEADRERIAEAMIADARNHDGIVVPDRVRARLTTNGGLQVHPRVLSAMYSHLARAGVLRFEAWTISQDHHGGNAGRPARAWRIVRQPALIKRLPS